jgi:hypothetical protein
MIANFDTVSGSGYINETDAAPCAFGSAKLVENFVINFYMTRTQK